MAERRMFAKTITESDFFLELSHPAQVLYFHLCQNADDEGFVNSPRKIMRENGVTEEHLNELGDRKFIIIFKSGVVAIKHWKIHNYIPRDRFHETKYKEERATLMLDENNAYSLNHGTCIQTCIQTDDNMETEVRLGKDSIGKVSLDKDSLGEVRSEEGRGDRIRRIEEAKRSLLNLYGKEINDA